MIYSHNVEREGMKGTIEVDLLPWKERISKSKELLYKIENEKLVEREDLERYELAIDFAISRVKKININVDGKESPIEDIDSLMMYKEGSKVMNEISTILINGIVLEKK